MKISISKEEWWPVYVPSDAEEGEEAHEVDDDFMERYNRIYDEFSQLTNQLRELYHKSEI